jgi:methyltransferase (TIGR00027 family)
MCAMADHDIAHVSDTALMTAACRALETARPDGFVMDPFAERLAGPRGMAIARALPDLEIMEFGVGVRTRFIEEILALVFKERAVATVVSVGAGLDSRPWRLELPAGLRWIEADYPEILEYKDDALKHEKPKCLLERVPTDLNDPERRRALFAAAGAEPALMITEGLLAYLPGATVQALAAEPLAVSGIRYWLADITSPSFARMVRMDSYRQIQSVRALDCLDGDGICAVIRENGWAPRYGRRYVKDTWGFAMERSRGMSANRPKRDPGEMPRPDDYTGVHLFAV